MNGKSEFLSNKIEAMLSNNTFFYRMDKVKPNTIPCFNKNKDLMQPHDFSATSYRTYFLLIETIKIRAMTGSCFWDFLKNGLKCLVRIIIGYS